MRRLLLAVFLSVCAATAPAAEIIRVPVNGTVAEAMNRLIVAVEGAGALVFARVDHAGGAAIVGQSLAPMEVLIFGNPAIGTPALQDAPMAGLMLPLRVLAYQDDTGAVFFAYEDPAAMLSAVGGNAEAAYVATISSALANLTAAASGN